MKTILSLWGRILACPYKPFVKFVRVAQPASQPAVRWANHQLIVLEHASRCYVRVTGPLRRKARNRFRAAHNIVTRIVLSSRSAVRLSTFPSSARARLTAAFLSFRSLDYAITLPGVSLMKSEIQIRHKRESEFSEEKRR